MSLTLDGVEAFFTHPDLHGKNFILKHPKQKKELGWLHYGGYKTWLAPQDNWNAKLPFFDLDSGAYTATVNKNVVTLESPVCRETGMQFGRKISLSNNGKITVHQTMTNRNQRTVTWGLWDVTQMKGKGKAIFPLHTDSKFEKRIKGYEDAGLSLKNMKEHVTLHEGLAILNCNQKENFKYGSDSDEGWLCGLLDARPNQWLAYLKLFEAHFHSHYAHDCVTEVFDSGSLPYFELEVHSPLQKLKPNESYTLQETWLLDWLPKKIDDKKIKKWIKGVR